MRESDYSLDTIGLEATIHELARSHAALTDLATRLECRIRELHVTWDGEAANAHRRAQISWGRGFVEMRDALERMRKAADSAHHNYAAAAGTNRAIWEQVR
jgi:WXG100 family type VII secretion target